MTATLISALVLLLGTIGSGIAWWIKRRDARADPLPRRAAELALAEASLGIIGASRDALAQDLERLRADREHDGHRLDTLTTEVHSLRREVRTLRTAWSRWYADLSERWMHHREQLTPPHPPTLD